MTQPFPDDTFDVAVMPLVIFFVPDPEKGVAEMVRVVCPGGAVTAYAWDMYGGGFPYEALQAEMRSLGITVRYHFWRVSNRRYVGFVDERGIACGRNAGDHSATNVRRLRRLLDDHPHRAERRPKGRSNGV